MINNLLISSASQDMATRLITLLEASKSNPLANKVIDYNLLNKAIDHLVSVANITSPVNEEW